MKRWISQKFLWGIKEEGKTTTPHQEQSKRLCWLGDRGFFHPASLGPEPIPHERRVEQHALKPLIYTIRLLKRSHFKKDAKVS